MVFPTGDDRWVHGDGDRARELDAVEAGQQWGQTGWMGPKPAIH